MDEQLVHRLLFVIHSLTWNSFVLDDQFSIHPVIDIYIGHNLDLARKLAQMDSVFKVSENVKYLGDFKKDFDLSMTESGFVDLANALFATTTVNQLASLSLYDAAGELLAFSERQPDGQLLAGFYYINPEKAFKYAKKLYILRAYERNIRGWC